MTYEQLIVLHAIVTEGTFCGAAERLNKSQSAISHMLKKLETEIEVPLLSRAAYRPKLTREGEVFYRQATRVMQQMQQLGNMAKSLSAGQEAEVTIMPVAHRDYEPARSVHMKTISQMQSYTQIVVADSSSGSFTQSRGLLPGGLRWTVSDFAAKKEILLAGMGWGGIPTHMIEQELESGELVPLNVEGYQPLRSHLFQIRRRDRQAGVVAQCIWEKLLAH